MPEIAAGLRGGRHLSLEENFQVKNEYQNPAALQKFPTKTYRENLFAGYPSNKLESVVLIALENVYARKSLCWGLLMINKRLACPSLKLFMINSLMESFLMLPVSIAVKKMSWLFRHSFLSSISSSSRLIIFLKFILETILFL